MKSFRKRATPITLINDDEVTFVLQVSSAEGRILEPVPLERLLCEQVDLSSVPAAFHQQTNSVMVVPDYWIGSVSSPFQSRKGSLAEAFLERKLQAEVPDFPEARDFFEYFFYESDQGETELFAYFIKEPKFFQAYEQLARWNLHPRRITTPAFLWESQLRERVEGFRQGGKAFVHALPNECFLYFFFDGHFLFSRQIALPEFEEGSPDQLETLTYETNQSLYLFSQKAKAEIDRVYMASFGHMDARELSEMLDKEVEEVASLEQELAEGSATIGQPGLLSGICLPDLSRSQKFLSIANKKTEKEQQWRPVQKTGIAVGLLLLLLLAGESVLLWHWSRPVDTGAGRAGEAQAREAVDELRQYDEALDLFLKESRRPAAGAAIINVASALPEEVWIKEMVIETEPDPGVKLTGTVRGAQPSQFREALSAFLDGLKDHFEGARSLSLQNIDVDTQNCEASDGGHACAISLEFGLP